MQVDGDGDEEMSADNGNGSGESDDVLMGHDDDDDANDGDDDGDDGDDGDGAVQPPVVQWHPEWDPWLTMLRGLAEYIMGHGLSG